MNKSQNKAANISNIENRRPAEKNSQAATKPGEHDQFNFTFFKEDCDNKNKEEDSVENRQPLAELSNVSSHIKVSNLINS